MTVATIIDLNKFCLKDTDGARYALGEPFVQRGFRYATDGRVIIRLPAKGEKNTAGKKLPECDELFEQKFNIGEGEFVEPVVKWIPGVIDCPKCDGSGFNSFETCGECDGDGKVECPTCEHVDECEECDGKGAIGEGTCSECGGKCDIKTSRAKGWLFGRLNNGQLLESVLSLPDILVKCDAVKRDQDSKPKAISFAFSGGDGILMPLENHGETEPTT